MSFENLEIKFDIQIRELDVEKNYDVTKSYVLKKLNFLIATSYLNIWGNKLMKSKLFKK